MDHAQEVRLAFWGSTGVPIPTKEHAALKSAALALGPDHVTAIREQVQRQLVEPKVSA